jgi:hypothetical protein
MWRGQVGVATGQTAEESDFENRIFKKKWIFFALFFFLQFRGKVAWLSRKQQPCALILT